jgi:enoyl-CoA hydratase/carnithine racemase
MCRAYHDTGHVHGLRVPNTPCVAHAAKECDVAFATILLDIIGPVARITLNRPECKNALNSTALRDIAEALDCAESRPEVRAVIVRGSGGCFSSGFDLKEQMERRPSGEAQWRPILRTGFDTIMRFWHCPKPTIAAVDGPCLAAGCELALACDLTIASGEAVFGEPELKFGAGIVVMLLPWLVGAKAAKEIILTGADRVSAERALQIGMINRVVPAAELDAAALQIARHLAAIDPELVKQTKRAINRMLATQGMLEGLESALAIDLAIEGTGTPDKAQFMEIARREGLKRALAWREARFPNAP